MNLKIILLATLLGVLTGSSILGPKTAKFIKNCNTDLVKGYGFRGVKKPIRKTLNMCPMIKKSCCRVQDQLTMYANWIHSKEKLEIESRFGLISKVFGKLMKLMVQTSKLSKKIVKKLEGKLLSNCKLLAKKILLFEIDATHNEIMKTFKKMEKFFVKSYSGFYCAICDHKNHLMVDMDDPTVFYSINFCREIVEHALIPVMYMNVHFKNMMSVVTRFVSSCDFKGTFTRDVPIKSINVFPVDEKVSKSLHECRDNRNKPAWFVECEPLCREFKLTKFSKIIAPSVARLAKYNKFLEGELKRINNEARLKVISGAGGTKKLKKKKTKKAKRERILAAKKDAKKKKKGPKKKKRENIYFTAKKPLITDKTKIDFIKSGLNFYKIGKSCVINIGIFNQVKNAIGLKKMNMVKAKGGMFGSSMLSRGLKSASILKGLVFLIMAFVYVR